MAPRPTRGGDGAATTNYPLYSSTFSGQQGRLLRVGRGLNCPFRHISDAVNASKPYDRIVIESGEYYEAICIVHPLELASSNDDEVPLISARGPCITINEYGSVLIENLRIIAKGSKVSDSMSIMVVHGKPLIRNCDLSAVQVNNESAPTITHCRINRANYGAGLRLSETAAGTYTHNDICFHPEECVRIHSSGQPTFSNNRVLQTKQSRAVILIAGSGIDPTTCRPIFFENIISGNGEASVEDSLDPAVLLAHAQLIGADVYSAEALVYVSWGARPVLRANYLCNGIHGFLFQGVSLPVDNFSGNRIATCTGWAICINQGTFLSIVNSDVQRCAGAVRVVDSNIPFFDSHIHGKDIPSRKSSPRITSSALSGLMEKESTVDLTNVDAFREELIQSIKDAHTAAGIRSVEDGEDDDGTRALRHINSSRSKEVISTQIIIRECSFRHNYHYGVYIDNSAVGLTDCVFSENMIGLAMKRDCTKCDVQRNRFDGHLIASVLIADVARVVFLNNTIMGASIAALARLLMSRHANRQQILHRYTGISSDHVDAHQAITFFGLCVLGNSELHLRNNNIGGNAFNLFSREFSIIHARENVFHQASESSITLVERCEAELRSNTFKESMGGGVCVDEHSRALIHTNSFMSLGRCGTSSHKRSRVMFLHNTLYSCGEGMAVHDGGIMHSEHNSISLGNTGVVATGKGSDITILHSHFFSSTRNFIHAKGCCIVNVRSTNFECSIGISLVMRNGVAGLVEKCSFVDGRDGIIHVESAGEAPPTHVDITACTFKRSDAAGVVAGPGSAGCITRCSFSYCKQVGLHLLAGARYEIHNNTVEACAGKGIEVLGSSRIHHNQIDGWCDESCENTLIGLRVAAHAKASIHDNHIMDCHIGMAADDEAAATIEDVEVRASVDAGILVNGAATQTIFRRVEINASDAAGIILRNGSRCRFEGCVVVECLQASVVVAHSGPTTLTECSFASTAACEVLGDEDYEMEVESSTRVARLGDSWKGARRPATASTAAGYASRPTTTASAAASPRVADAPPGLTSFLHCTIGGDVSRQGVLALSSSMHVEDCEVHAAHIAHTSDRPVSPFHLNARRKRKQISDAFGKTINHESKSKSRRMEGGVGIYAADGALVEVRNTTIFACPCAGLLLQPGAHARVEHCAITECGVGALLVGTPTILSRIQGEGGGRTGSSGGKRSRRGNAATSTQSLFTGPNITSQVILGRTFTKSECGVHLRHVAVSDCTAAGMLFYVGSAARVDGSSIQKCRDGVVVGEEASIFMEQTTIESSQRHGIHLIGAPQSTSTLTGLRVEHCSGYGVLQLAVPTKNDLLASRSATPDDGGLHSLFDQLHAASSLPQMQSCTTTAPPEPAALVEMITTTSMMSFHGCEFNDNEGGSAMLEGSTRFVDCRFASSEAITGVACHGNGSRSIFSSCHFAHSMKVHLVAEMEACVVLHKCVLESCPHAVVMLEAARLIAQECAMRSCGSAMIYAPSVLSQRKRAKMHVEMCKSPVLAGRVTSPFEHSSTGTYERRAGTTTTTMLVMEACNIHDCEVGVESRTTSLQWQNPNAVVLPEETKKTRLALRTSTPMMCDLRRCVVDGSRNVGVCLDGLCREASLRQCVITACGNGVDLRTSLHAKKVLLEDCQLERSNVGLCIGGGEAVHVRRCTFSEQKEWAVRLVGGEEVVLRDSTFVGNRSGAIVVDVSLHASLNALRTIIDESGGNRKLASGAWRDIFTLCRRWIIKENTFAQTSSGVVVPPLMVPAHARPMLYVYSNSFAHCEYGLLCRPMEDAGSDQKPLHVQECAEEHPEMVALLHETDEPLQTMVLQNLFEDNHYGCYLSGTTTTAHVWSNDFVRNHQSGIYVAEGAAPMVMDNVFEKHGGEAPKEKAAPLMSDAALASLDAHSALRICSGARGHYAHNRFHANQVAVCLDAVGAATPTTSAAEDAPPPWMGLTINDNQFLRNGRGIRLCGDCHADILNNTFMDGFSHDVHISRNGASTSHALLAYNRFVSMQIPVAILVDESAHLQLHRCILSGNADVAVRARPYATCCITESLFLGVGIGIDVEDRAHVYLHNSYLLQHHHRALCCRSKGEAHVERCSIMSYPDHHSIECCADAKLMLQSCFFLSATHVSGALTPIILCSGNVHILSCHMEGRQPGLVIESKTFAEVERSNFYGCDIGIINQTHGNMRALRCFFWMNKLASIKLFEHSNGNVEECMMAEGTITAMGAHHVVMDEARIPASCPFAPTTALTVAECEELLLRRFAELLVESPSWVIEKKQISNNNNNNTTGSTQKQESGAVNASQAGDMTTVAGEQDEDDVEEDEDAFVSLQRSYHRSNTGSVADEEEQKKSEEKEGGGGDEAAEREKHAAAVAAAVAAAGAEFVAKTLDGNNHVAEKKKPQPKKLANQPPPPPPPNGKKKKAPQKKPPPLNTPPPLLEAKEVCGRLNHVDPHRMPERIRDALTSWQAREDGEEASEISSAPPRRPARGSSAATTTTTTTTIVATASAECTPSPARGGAPADATKLEEHRLPSLATDVNAILAALQTRRMKQLGDGDIQAGPIPQSLARTASVATSRLESIQQLNRSSIYSSPVPPRGGGRTSPDGLVKLDVAATSSSSPLSKKKAAAATSAAGSPAVAKQWNPNFIHGVKHGELTDAHKKEMEQYAQQQRERRRRRRRHHPLRSVHLQHGEPFMTNPYQRLPTSLPIFIMERVAHGKDYTPVEVHPFPSFDKEYIFLTPNLGYNIFLHDFCYRFGDDHLPAVLPVLMASDSQSPRSRKHRSVSEGGGTTSLCSSMNWTLTPAGTPRQEISGEFTSQYGGGAPGSSYSRKSLHTNNGEGGAWKEGSLSLGSQRTKKSGAESPFAATGGGRMSGDLRGGSSGVLGGSAGTLTSMHGNRDYDGRIGAPSGPTSRNNTGDVLDGLGMDEARRARRDSTGRGGKNRSRSLLDMDLSGLSATDGGSPGHRGCGAAGDARRGGPGGGISGSGSGSGGVGGRDGSVPKKGKGKKKGGVGSKSSKRGASKTKKRGGSRGDAMGDATSSTNDARGKQGISSTEFGDADDENAVAAKKRNAHTAEGGHFGSIIGGSDGGDPLDGSPVRGGASFASSSFRPDISSTTNPPSRGAGTAMGSSSTHGMSVPRGSGGSASPPGSGHGRGDGDGDGAGGWSSLEGRLGSSNERAGVKGSGDATLSRGVSGPELAFMGTNYSDTSTTSALPQLTVSSLAFANTLGSKPEVQHKNLQSIIDSVLREEEEEEDSRNGRGTRDEDAYGSSRGSRHFRDEINAAGHTSRIDSSARRSRRLGDGDDDAETSHDSIPAAPLVDFSTLELDEEAMKAVSVLKRVGNREFEDVLAILHWLAERRARMKKEKYVRVIDEIFDESKLCFFRPPPPSPHSDSGVVIPFPPTPNSRGSMARLLSRSSGRPTSMYSRLHPSMSGSMPTTKQDEINVEVVDAEGEDAEMIYIPFPAMDAATDGAAASSEAAHHRAADTPMLAVRMVSGIGITEVRVVHMEAEEIPLHAANYSDSRSRRTLLEHLGTHHPEHLPELRQALPTHDLPPTMAAMHARPNSRAASRSSAPSGSPTSPAPRSMSYEELQHHLQNNASRLAYASTALPHFVADSRVLRTEHSLKRRPLSPLKYLPASALQHHKLQKVAPRLTFDPADPSKTTPFATDNRPLTYNAMGLMKWE